MKSAIIIMTKAPRSGFAKTRLGGSLLPEQRARLASAFIEDTLAKAKRASENIVIAYHPGGGEDEMRSIVGEDELLMVQEGSDLGERIFHAFETVMAKGYDYVVMIGTDSPTMPADFLEQASEFLEMETDAVLGKTEDGGFHLIGLRRLKPEIFGGVEWSTDRAFDRVWKNIRQIGWHLREVPPWYDVDGPDDLEKLWQELSTNENARRRAPKTFEWMSANYIRGATG